MATAEAKAAALQQRKQGVWLLQSGHSIVVERGFLTGKKRLRQDRHKKQETRKDGAP